MKAKPDEDSPASAEEVIGLLGPLTENPNTTNPRHTKSSNISRAANGALCVLFAVLLGCYALGSSWVVRETRVYPDLAKTANGTYRGVLSREHRQYMFLGMPYALPPTGSHRFRQARPVNESWTGVRSAEMYGPDCWGYGVSSHSATQPHPHPTRNLSCLCTDLIQPRLRSLRSRCTASARTA
jgi:hypothetical protein